jgi:hypothetical protein
VSKPGVEPTTRPLLGWPAKSGCRKRVCCNHPKIDTPQQFYTLCHLVVYDS